MDCDAELTSLLVRRSFGLGCATLQAFMLSCGSVDPETSLRGLFLDGSESEELGLQLMVSSQGLGSVEAETDSV